jgi:hypothetical protein
MGSSEEEGSRKVTAGSYSSYFSTFVSFHGYHLLDGSGEGRLVHLHVKATPAKVVHGRLRPRFGRFVGPFPPTMTFDFARRNFTSNFSHRSQLTGRALHTLSVPRSNWA